MFGYHWNQALSFTVIFLILFACFQLLKGFFVQKMDEISKKPINSQKKNWKPFLYLVGLNFFLLFPTYIPNSNIYIIFLVLIVVINSILMTKHVESKSIIIIDLLLLILRAVLNYTFFAEII